MLRSMLRHGRPLSLSNCCLAICGAFVFKTYALEYGMFVNHCLRCDYPLDQLPKDVCPECGLEATPAGLEAWLAPERRRTNTILLLALGWFALYFGGNDFLVGTVDRIQNKFAVVLLLPILNILLPGILFFLTWEFNRSKQFANQKTAITMRKYLVVWLAAHAVISAMTLLL